MNTVKEEVDAFLIDKVVHAAMNLLDWKQIKGAL